MLLINIGAPYPNNPLTLVFKDNARPLGQPSIKSKAVQVFILGKLTSYNGKPQMKLQKAAQLLRAPQ